MRWQSQALAAVAVLLIAGCTPPDTGRDTGAAGTPEGSASDISGSPSTDTMGGGAAVPGTEPGDTLHHGSDSAPPR